MRRAGTALRLLLQQHSSANEATGTAGLLLPAVASCNQVVQMSGCAGAVPRRLQDADEQPSTSTSQSVPYIPSVAVLREKLAQGRLLVGVYNKRLCQTLYLQPSPPLFSGPNFSDFLMGKDVNQYSVEAPGWKVRFC
jgi:hypothetical protein